MKTFWFMNLVWALCCSGLLAAGNADNTLTDAEKQDGWVLLFNGQDFTGWKADKWNPGSFSIEDGAIKCNGNPSMLYYIGEGCEMKDFHFVADVMTQPGANGGIFFHTKYQDKGWPIGHEAQIDNSHKDPVRTGSIYIVAKNLVPPAKDNTWFRYEIIVRGKTIQTKVDGKTILTYVEPDDVQGTRKLSSGTIGIQAHDPGSVVMLKNIKVKPLAAE